MRYKNFRLASFKALADQPEGTFEAIVAVFGNVDRAGDKIMPGAFTDTLADWAAKGRPIPVIFSHQWENLDAHIGQVLEAKEVQDGLYVKGQLDMDEPFAQRVWKKMNAGTLAEFSFAYDIVDMAQIKQEGEWVNELRKLDLMEVGPCLVGMNPDTQLLGVKGAGGSFLDAFEAALAALQGKEGRRNSDADLGRIQRIHDLCGELGAKCAKGEGTAEDQTGDGKSSGPESSTIRMMVAVEQL